MSPRRLWVLIKNLPRDSAFIRKIDPDLALTFGEHVTVTFYDEWRRIHFKSPQPYPMPSESRKQAKAAADRRARLERQAARVERRQREGGGGG